MTVFTVHNPEKDDIWEFLASSEDNFFVVKKKDMTSKRRAYGKLKQDTTMKMAIPCRTKLDIALQYLTSGDSMHSLVLLFRVAHNSVP